MLDTPLSKACNDVFDFRPKRRPKLKRPPELVINGHHHHGVTIFMDQGKLLINNRWNRDAFHLHKAAAADADGVTHDADVNAVAHTVLSVICGR